MKMKKMFLILGPAALGLMMLCCAGSPTGPGGTSGNVSSTPSTRADSIIDVPLWKWRFNSMADGCRGFVVYLRSDSGNAAIAVQAKAESLSLSRTPRRFDLSAKNPNLKVSVDVFNKDPNENIGYCNDWIDPMLPIVMVEQWEAVLGVAYISTSVDTPPPITCRSGGYCVTVILDTLVVRNPVTKKILRAPGKIEFKNVFVGWLPG